ncbi:T9SS type A sorting domain-containing protein [Chryseobacterium sp. Bi04]|uniref:T9SS type A sorting domain-containing protein n=1 Tax=Chryseobacterium sp. Bi04 TaxID=2822345 RepID=UPI001DB86CEF|nr:T9SS type A sorting domain-containing protein [Chryseobacterium sp. Bi04]CAH0213978.1 hypothetical protein SRABI04_02296 [Chryseobacterium sp. Bi04]
MKTKIFLLFFLSFGVNMIFAQGENDNWYFGTKAAVNFSNASPLSLTNSQMTAIEACGTVSDAGGNLLFYTNGQTIWNKDHQVMQNGSGLDGHSSSEQLAIVKHPTNPNQYFVITTTENGVSTGSNAIKYSIVDMSQGALGAVLPQFKNITIVDSSGNSFQSEAVTVVPNASNGSLWVLIPNGTRMYSYRVDGSGFNNGNPVVSNLNLSTPLGNTSFFGVKASPRVNRSVNYTHFVCISLWKPVSDLKNQVYSFNSVTGQLTNDFLLQVNGLGGYLSEFNKDGSVLFLGYENMYAVDLLTSTPSNINYAMIHGDVFGNPFFGLQRNTKGDVYVSSPGQPYLGKIINPNGNISAMSVNMSDINLNGPTTFFGLPQLVNSYEPVPYYPCITDLTLATPELNNNFTYNVGKDIKTIHNYTIGGKQRIIMNAGNSITLLPNTHIMAESYTAKIVPCDRGSVDRISNENKGHVPVKMVLELDKEVRMKLNNDIKIYPNPVSDILTISTTDVNSIEIFDISGKKMGVSTNGNKIDVRNIPAGNYLLYIQTKGGVISKPFIKK